MSFEFKTLFFKETSGFFTTQLDSQLLQQKLNKLGQSGWQVSSCTNSGSQLRPALIVILQRAR